jgi:hypothetical protein
VRGPGIDIKTPLQKAPLSAVKALEHALRLINLHVGGGGDVPGGKATAEALDGIHGIVVHVYGEEVALQDATKAREA